MGNNLIFGGVNIITVGDLYQLKPVIGQFIFEDYSRNYEPLATNLWTEYFKIYNLTLIMRQKDDKKLAQLLNRLRTGNHTKNDIRTLKHTKMSNKHLQNKKINTPLLSYSAPSRYVQQQHQTQPIQFHY